LLAQAPKCAPVPPDLTARFSFEEAAPQAARVPGVVGQGLSFDGVKQYHEIPSSPGVNFGTGDFTIELWIRTADVARTRNILDKRDESPRGYALFIERRGHLGFQVAAHEPNWVSVMDHKNVIADGRWHHVAGVVKRLPAQPPMLFVDGERRGSIMVKNVPLDTVDNDVPLWLGRHHKNVVVPKDSYFWNGAVDELAFYRRALTPEQIKSIFQAGRAGKCR
jgi:hypothetical protein